MFHTEAYYSQLVAQWDLVGSKLLSGGDSEIIFTFKNAVWRYPTVDFFFFFYNKF